ncbi:hypothetical protein [Kibdelosporangium phytohabitans]|uniref:hypothetical protein n=1 Tax=Kibdelosporangium phytohabitans TaxID=860235 RepID=UPI0014708050|nr:hypothetical protein [Kibdelosporangium phytohabitans]MBE1467069.1 hypothetical protein [Kibdelosporangium phytohabitans]
MRKVITGGHRPRARRARERVANIRQIPGRGEGGAIRPVVSRVTSAARLELRQGEIVKLFTRERLWVRDDARVTTPK